ncbi:carboxylesterase family domain-containing protein [Ditylenchus destructor]|uniref:Carboxylic ester hydrolase n=1 Tax=Ditylenchus destructor TaxID=166010 RepID=A0AAD4R2M1_9BILA|nr:carboxylesterase family domain-containing protein [Ditylenchus destructor]
MTFLESVNKSSARMGREQRFRLLHHSPTDHTHRVFIVFIITVFPREFLLHANASVRSKDYIAMNDEHPNNYSLSELNTTRQGSDMQTETQYIDVEISGGIVRGVISNVGSRPANVFRGIPQAEPPVGKLRFEQLRARQSWRPKVWNAMEYRPACLSNTSKTTSPQFNIDEDCIYTNIYADPECRKVFVICAYRIGFLGFLDLGNDDVVPRNLAFYDIIHNLEWARKEIRSFGGDPEQITIMGNSAGASFVIYLLQSPKVPRGMFKQAVVSSGIALIMRDLDRQPSLEILRRFKCLHDDKTNLTFTDRNKVECMRNVNANDIITVQRRNEDTLNLTFRGPETDTKLLPGEIFWDLLPSHKAHPLLITTTSVETTFFPNTLDVECRAVEMHKAYIPKAVHSVITITNFAKVLLKGKEKLIKNISDDPSRLRSTVWTPLGVPLELMVLLLLMVIMMAIFGAVRIMNRYRSYVSPATESTRIFSKDTTRRILYT